MKLSFLWLRMILMVLLLLSANWLMAESVTNEECLDCHNDPELTKTDNKGKEISLYVNPDKFANSLHGEFQCIDCHTDIKEVPHDEQLERPNCAQCHDDVAEVYMQSYHGKALAEGEEDAPACWDCHSSHYVYPADDSLSWTSPLNQPATCATCHSDPRVVKKYHIPIPNPTESYTKSVHFKTIMQEDGSKAATCSACHSAHGLQPLTHPDSWINRNNIPKTCSQCHEEVYEEYMQSVHGQGLLNGASDAPVCTDCHSEHSIKAAQDPTSTVYSTVVSQATCGRCHEAELIVSKYGLAKIPVQSYYDSYHGLAMRGGSTVAANCASCHGVHNILPSSDERSSINPANLVETCRKCHPGVTEQVAKGKVHITDAKESSLLIYYVTNAYILLIVMVIGGMVLHNLLDLIKKARTQREHAEFIRVASGKEYVRLTVNERIQHVLLMVSFTVLVITGFALKYPEAWWTRMMMTSDGTVDIRGLFHRGAAVVMVALAFYHVWYLIFTKRGRQQLKDFLPGMKDIWDVIGIVKYNLGLSSQRPEFERYNYAEKAEYWALIWGTIVMGITGFILWFPNITMAYFPKWLTDVSTTVHYYEAILATLAIIVWHFYFQFLDPHVYPFNFTCMTGKISEEALREEHKLEYERLESQQETALEE